MGRIEDDEDEDVTPSPGDGGNGVQQEFDPYESAEFAVLIRRIAVNLRQVRKKRGWSQARLAAEGGFPDSSLVGRLELGRVNPMVTTLARLTHALNVDILRLFKDTDEPLPAPRRERPGPRKRARKRSLKRRR